MPDRQYVAAEFNKGGRTYTYHNDGEPVAIGDRVDVLTPRGEQTVTVIRTFDGPRPPFETRPIIGKERSSVDTLTDGDDRDLEATLGDAA
jgi:hypothetical protein